MPNRARMVEDDEAISIRDDIGLISETKEPKILEITENEVAQKPGRDYSRGAVCYLRDARQRISRTFSSTDMTTKQQPADYLNEDVIASLRELVVDLKIGKSEIEAQRSYINEKLDSITRKQAEADKWLDWVRAKKAK